MIGYLTNKLFNVFHVHQWVNYHGMLEKCFVGNYEKPNQISVSKSAIDTRVKSSGLSVPNVSFAPKPKIITDKNSTVAQVTSKAPSLDS